MIPQGETRNAGTRPEHDAAHSLASEVAERSRRCERELSALVQDVQAILQRHEERAREAADRLVIEARIEAARVLAEARHEVTALTDQIASLKRAQHDASVALQQTRDALTAALGSVEVAQSPTPPRTLPPAPVPAQITKETPTAPWPPRVLASAERAGIPGPPVTARVRNRHRAMFRRPWVLGTGAAVLLAIAAAVWSIARGQPQPPEGAASAVAETRDPRATAAPAALPASRPQRGGVHPSRAPAAPLSVTLEAVRPVWVRATVDGRTEKGSELAAGTRRRVTASSEVVIRAGDAGALLVAVDGSDKRRFGRDGQILTRRFERSASTAAAPGRADAERPRQRDQAAAAPEAAGPFPPAAPVPLADIPVTSARGALGATAVGTSLALAAPPAPPERRRAPSTVSDEILDLDRQWFDAYYRNERTRLASLSAPGFEMADSRAPVQERRPASPPDRSMRDVRVDVHADGAVLSGRMIERLSGDGETREEESFVSEVWVRRDGTWRLLSLRLASVDQVRQTGTVVK